MPMLPKWVLPVASALLAALLTGFITYAICDWSKTRALEKQKADMIEAHVQSNQLSEEVSNGIVKELATVKSNLANAKRLYGNRCVRVASPASGNAGQDRAELHRSDEGLYRSDVGTDELLDYSGDGDTCAARFNGCSAQLDAIYCRNGQKEYCK